MRLNHYLSNSNIYNYNSENTAFAIWTQGCNIRCKGCWNKHTWDKDGGFSISIDDLVEKIIESGDPCVTILGGEPFNQYEELIELVKKIRLLKKQIILYTGFEKEDIPQEILSYIDILICGSYKEELRVLDHHLIGSTNQRIIKLTDAFGEDIKDMTAVEVRIDSNGGMDVFGYPEELIDLIKNG